jgi:predicted ribosome quality control (RQC) complex YloA/Tae2 family protein
LNMQQNNYFVLSAAVDQLSQRLVGSYLREVYSQNKDEIVLAFQLDERDFFIRAVMLPNFSCLGFPAEIYRKGKNTVDLFPSFIDLKVQAVTMTTWDRSFKIELGHQHVLLFKMHGNQSNLIGFEKGVPVEIFKNGLKKDMELHPAQLEANVSFELAAQADNPNDIRKHLRVLDDTLVSALMEKGWSQKTTADRLQCIHDFLLNLRTQNTFFIHEQDGAIPIFSLNRIGNHDEQYANVLDALTRFQNLYFSREHLQSEKKLLVNAVERSIKQTEAYINNTEKRLSDLANEVAPEEIGHMIMANLHSIQSGSKEALVFDFYRNVERKISLKQELNPQQNAEYYYRKSKNRKIEISKLEESLMKKYQQLEKQKAELAELLNTTEPMNLRKFIKQSKKQTKPQAEPKPYKEFIIEEYQVWVGKNSKSNDSLTGQYASKDDLWLHARGVGGSHVIIKKKGNLSIPNSVLEKAASLAAYYSKGKSSDLCPVIYTPRKFVRKAKGLAPGQVLVDREEVIIVPPKAFAELENT